MVKLRKRLENHKKLTQSARVIQIWWKYNRPSQKLKRKLIIHIKIAMKKYVKQEFQRKKDLNIQTKRSNQILLSTLKIQKIYKKYKKRQNETL